MYEGGGDTSTFPFISALDGHEWSTPYPSPFTPLERDHVPIVQEAGWAPQPVQTGRKNLASTAVGTPDRPACSESLHQLCYPCT